MSEYIGMAIGAIVLVGMVFWGWKTIPAEPVENVEARKRYGHINDPMPD